MSIILDLKRTNLVNKCDPHQIDNEVLKFYLREGNVTAYLKEAIAEVNDVFSQVSVFRNGTELIQNTDYTVDNNASTITLIGPDSQSTNNVTATYTGTGSIIWTEDVNELQTAAQVLATNALDKNGDTMAGNLNMGGNNITNPGTVDGVDISSHNHAGGQGGLIGTAGLESGAVTSSVLADNSVITSKIENLAVTDAKIESISFNKVLGLSGQFANRYLTNLETGLENVVCTENPTTTRTATIQKPIVIIDAYKNSSDGTWYKLYSNGWIEMGGIKYVGTDSSASVTFPNNIILTDTSYHIILTPGVNSNATGGSVGGPVWYRPDSKATSGFTIINDLQAGDICWEVKGIVTGTSSRILYRNDEIMYNISGNTVNELYTYICSGNDKLHMELAGSTCLMSGWTTTYADTDGGGIIHCTATFSIGDRISVKALCSSTSLVANVTRDKTFNYYGPVSVGIYRNDSPILIAAAGALAINPRGAHDIWVGGSGYTGGLAENRNGQIGVDLYNGLSWDGSFGQSAVDSANIASGTGVSHTNQSGDTILQAAWGGIGYVASGYTNSYTSSSKNHQNAYVKLSLIQ
jgi:hypothetical protein